MVNTIKRWKSAKTRDLILAKELSFSDEKLAKSFASKIKFGLNGIFGEMGAGTNKINEFTVAAAAQAYAKVLLLNTENVKKRGIVIGHDNRYNSKLFAEVVASVFLYQGIKTYLYDNNALQPTPFLSYTIRKMKLAGGVFISASHSPKEYNGLKFYNSFGAKLMQEKAKKMQDIMDKINPLKISRSTKSPLFISKKFEQGYLDKIASQVQLRNDKKQIKIAFSPLHGTSGEMVPKILQQLGYDSFAVKKQLLPDGNFKYAKSFDPENIKSYSKVVSLARQKKAHLAIAIDPDADRIGIAVKYKKRYKYLTGNQVASLYLDYKLNQLKSLNKIPKNGYIVKSIVSGDLPKKIAQKFGVKVYETHVGFKNIAHFINQKTGTFLMGYEESYGMLISKNVARVKDPIQTVVGVAEMINYYTLNNINIFDHLNSLYGQYGIHRTTQLSKKLSLNMTKRLLKRMTNVKKVGNKQVKEIHDYRHGYNNFSKKLLVKVILNNGSWLAITPAESGSKVKIYVETVGTSKQKLMDVVIFEKIVYDFVEENTEVIDYKKFSWKTLLKYLIFMAIMLVILVFVFRIVYGELVAGKHSFGVARFIFDNKIRWIFLFGIVQFFFPISLHSLQKKRMITSQGQNVKWRHLVISAIMGQFVSWITPLTIGGDGIGYWYLRRKGFRRSPLASSFLMSTVIYQIQLILISSILLPLGIIMFKDELLNGSADTRIVIALFISGVSWNIFATFMILMLTFVKPFQEWIVRTTIHLLEWLPFVHVMDPGGLSSRYQHMFFDVRNGMRTLRNKKSLLLECFMYQTITSFVVLTIFVPILLGILNDDLYYGSYFSQIVAGDVIKTANSFSITPGGSGTGEYISIVVNTIIYKPIGGNTSSETAAAINMLLKFIVEWPILLVSLVTIFIIIIGEGRAAKYKNKNKNDLLTKKVSYKTQTSFYYKSAFIFVLIAIIYVLLLALL